MTDRDWDKEMRKIDEQMERAARQPAPAAPSSVGPITAPRTSAGAPAGVGAVGVPPATNFGVFARLALATALGVGIIFWPYSARCGFGLAVYLGAVITVVVSGAWSAIWTWRHRWGRAHLLGLLLVVWGLVLLSAEVLPRVGYAIPTAAHPAAWSCS